MTNLIVLGIIVLILTIVVVYIVRAKRSGVRCIGCPSGSSCGSASKKDDTACACTQNGQCGGSCHSEAES